MRRSDESIFDFKIKREIYKKSISTLHLVKITSSYLQSY